MINLYIIQGLKLSGWRHVAFIFSCCFFSFFLSFFLFSLFLSFFFLPFFLSFFLSFFFLLSKRERKLNRCDFRICSFVAVPYVWTLRQKTWRKRSFPEYKNTKKGEFNDIGPYNKITDSWIMLQYLTENGMTITSDTGKDGMKKTFFSLNMKTWRRWEISMNYDYSILRILKYIHKVASAINGCFDWQKW